MPTRVQALLRRYIAALPARRQGMHDRSPGIKEAYTRFKVEPPEANATSLPTLDPKVTRALSPQLADWYATVGQITENAWKYLSPASMKRVAKQARLREVLAAHREYWDGSAPMRFPDSQLAVFAVIGDLDDGDLIYLVWPKPDTKEPELWEYFGQSHTRYKDLAAYLQALLAS